ncbi:MAG: hypothetical protein AAGD04_12195 [Pseudomonadota bacterium]
MCYKLAMGFVTWALVAVFILGCGIALYEWRKGRALLAHDFNLDKTSVQSKIAAEQANDGAHQSSMRSGLSDDGGL